MSEDPLLIAAMRAYHESGAAREGEVLAILFASRDAYAQIHERLMGGPLTRLARKAGIASQPDFRSLGRALAALEPLLVDIRPEITALSRTYRETSYGIEEYLEILILAIDAMHTLVNEAAEEGGMSKVAPATLATYLKVAGCLDDVGKVLRTPI